MLSAFDKKLLNLLQTNLPVEHRPFEVLAQQMDSDESTVLHRIRELKRDGYIRRIGPFFNSDKLDYFATLVAVDVDAEHIDEVVKAINEYPGATHNYEREGKYNIWFALLTPNNEQRKRIIDHISGMPGVNDIMDLEATKKYKINVQFKLQ